MDYLDLIYAKKQGGQISCMCTFKVTFLTIPLSLTVEGDFFKNWNFKTYKHLTVFEIAYKHALWD